MPATPMLELAIVIGPNHRCLDRPMRSMRWFCRCTRRRLIGVPPVGSEPPEQHKDDNDDQDEADDADATVAEAVAVAAEAATKAAEQENDEKDNEDGSDRHDLISLPWDLTLTSESPFGVAAAPVEDAGREIPDHPFPMEMQRVSSFRIAVVPESSRRRRT
jgi:hypothetical protein